MYTLYHFPYSQHARRIVSLLEECDIPYQLKHVAMDQGEHMSSGFLKLNPNHQVPVLEDGEFRIYESNAILRYLCNQHRLTTWYPEDARIRGKVDQWLDWNQCRLSPAVIDVVLNKVFLGKDGDAAAIKRGEIRLKELLPILESGFDGKKYLACEHPTIADLSVASNIFQLGLAEIGASGKTAAWYQRILDLPGFEKSLPQM